MDISFQLYSAREFTPWDGVLKRLADLGYTQVEGFGGNYENPAAFREMLDANDLKMPSGHFFPMEQFEDDLAKVIDTAKTLGMERIFVPAVPPEQRIPDAALWQSIAGRLETIGEKIRDAGLRFGWHNHDFEFKACPDGRLPMDILMEAAPSIEWEADIAWIVRGNQDLAPEGECADEDGWADVGQGTMDWQGIMKALKGAGVDLFVMEHDKPSDFDRFATRSIAAFRAY